MNDAISPEILKKMEELIGGVEEERKGWSAEMGI
ncbi:hypothetical protein SLEP1_g39128 [Rubroshorea leprosula]|uniref:Uncharacterized protein n=1 Tax=Rubroshorea leprosula TaxID=152421 RepID=A0AAV5KZI4_9ROSI|nr:hypothetical protein SLEP1_g39128 [Rubroshorea leprosula]